MGKHLPPGMHAILRGFTPLTIPCDADPSHASPAEQALEPYKKLPDTKGMFLPPYALPFRPRRR